MQQRKYRGLADNLKKVILDSNADIVVWPQRPATTSYRRIPFIEIVQINLVFVGDTPAPISSHNLVKISTISDHA
jgi:hypothetical protein